MTKKEKAILVKKARNYWAMLEVATQQYGDDSKEAATARARWATVESIADDLGIELVY